MHENMLASDLDYILENTSSIWHELRNKRIFITGGTGFIGSWLLETFVWANHKFDLNLSVVALTRDVDAFRKKVPHLAHDITLTFLPGDVRDFSFPSERFSHVILGATPSSLKLDDENQGLMLETIVQGTRHTLAFAKHAHAKKILFLSSGAVYGKQPTDLEFVDEDYQGSPDILNPSSAYGVGKRTAEHMCVLQAKQSQAEVKIARCFAFIGPYLPLDRHFAIGNFLGDGLRNKTINIHGDGTTYRSYLYAADLAIWLLHIFSKGKSCAPYNVGSDDAISILNLAKLVAKSFKPQPEIELAKTPQQNRVADRYIPSVKKARETLGLEVKISLRDGIEKTIAWHKKRCDQLLVP